MTCLDHELVKYARECWRAGRCELSTVANVLGVPMRDAYRLMTRGWSKDDQFATAGSAQTKE